MLIAASPALSSDSQADSWPPDSPTARSSANSVTRSRAETAALTTKPRTAKTAAAMNPIANAPMTPSATGSVDRARARSAWLTTESLRSAASRSAAETASSAVGVDRQPPLVGRDDRVAALELEQRQGRQVHDDDRAATRRWPGSAWTAPASADGARDAADRHRQRVADVAAGRLEERVRDDDRGRRAADRRERRRREADDEAAPEVVAAGDDGQPRRTGRDR